MQAAFAGVPATLWSLFEAPDELTTSLGGE
jgi:hypothetical protein